MFSKNSKNKLSSTEMPRALRARQAFFAELFLAIFAEHVKFALILAPYFGVDIIFTQNINAKLACSLKIARRSSDQQSENSKQKVSSTKMPRALRARQAFFAELFLAIFAERVNFALVFCVNGFFYFVRCSTK